MIDIHRVTPANLALFDRVADDIFDAPIDPTRLAAYAAAPGHLMLLAVENNLVVGQIAAVVHFHPDQATELYIDNLGVAPGHQRQGIARRLLDGIVALGREHGCEEVWVGTEADNGPANALYRRNAEAEAMVMFAWKA